MVRLASIPRETTAGWTIGHDEADNLLLDRDTGEIRVIEIGTNGHVVARCASGGSGLLSALAAATRYLASTATAADLSLDIAEVHKNCVTSAGGDIYSDYWAYLLGIE